MHNAILSKNRLNVLTYLILDSIIKLLQDKGKQNHTSRKSDGVNVNHNYIITPSDSNCNNNL